MIRQISVFVENSKGKLANITKILKDNHIHIRALSIADTTDFGILRLIVSDPQKAYDALKEHGRTASITSVLAVGFPDTPGSMGNTANILSDAGITIEYLYAFGLKGDAMAYGVFKTSQPEYAAEVLKKHNIKLLEENDIYSV